MVKQIIFLCLFASLAHAQLWGVEGLAFTGSTTTNLGTITTAIWHGTPIANGYLANGAVANLTGTNSGDVTLSGENYLSLSGQVITANAVNLSGSNVTGILAAARFPALTGDVTTSSGAIATTIANNVVTLAKMATVSTATVLGRNTSGTGNVESLTTIPTGVLPAFSGGDVTSSAGSLTLTVGSGAVTLAKMANMTTASLIYRKTAGTGAPEVNTLAQLKTDLALVKGDVGLGSVENTALSSWAGSSNITTVGTLASPTLTTPVINGLATGTGIASTATASTIVTRDVNANITANNWIGGYRTTATAAATTTLTVSDTYLQYFTGSTTQTVALPAVSSLALGHQFVIVNNSSGAVTVNSSGGNAVIILAGSTSAIVTSIATSGTDATVWSVSYAADNVTSAKKLSVSNTLTLAGTDGTIMTFPGTSATIARTDAANTFTGVQTMTSPSFTTPVLGTPTSGNLANCTFPTLNQNTTGTANISGGTAGAIPYQSAANTTAILASTATANKPLMSGASAAPTWSTITIPNTTGTVGQYAMSDGANMIWTDNSSASIVSASGAINTTETVIAKTPALAANRLLAGTVIRIVLFGTCTSSAANVSTFAVRIGTAGSTSDGLMESAATAVSATTGTSIPFRAEYEITIRTTGSSATSHGCCSLWQTGVTGIAAQTTQVILPTFTTFSTTTASNIISVTYKSAATTTTCTFQDCYIEFVTK